MIHPDDMPPLVGVRDPLAIHQWLMMASALRQSLLMLAANAPAAAVHDLKLASVRYRGGLEASGGETNGPIQRAASVSTLVALCIERGTPLTVTLVAELGQVVAMLSAWSAELVGRHAAELYPPTTADEVAAGAERRAAIASAP